MYVWTKMESSRLVDEENDSPLGYPRMPEITPRFWRMDTTVPPVYPPTVPEGESLPNFGRGSTPEERKAEEELFRWIAAEDSMAGGPGTGNYEDSPEFIWVKVGPEQELREAIPCPADLVVFPFLLYVNKEGLRWKGGTSGVPVGIQKEAEEVLRDNVV